MRVHLLLAVDAAPSADYHKKLSCVFFVHRGFGDAQPHTANCETGLRARCSHNQINHAAESDDNDTAAV